MIIYQGLLLDGRNRYRAARELGLKLTAANFKTFDGTPAEAEAFVISANLHRRQLNNKQKQEFAQKMIAKYPDEVRQGARADDFSLEEHNRRGTRRSCTLAR